jgi:[ribosomal protein S5]-alanine N-acetyltransferase
MELETERLIIRNMEPEDISSLAVVYSDPEVMKYLEPPFDFKETELFVKKYGLSPNPLIYCIVDKKSGKPIGHLIFHPFDAVSHEIGWVLAKASWRQGLASEMTGAIKKEAKDKGIKRLVIECSPEQKASKAIALKEGFTYHGKEDNLDVYFYEIN